MGVKNTIKYKPYDTFILEEEPIEIALGLVLYDLPTIT